MKPSLRRVALALVVLAFAASSALTAKQNPSKADAERLSRKINLIAERGLVPRRTPLRTTVTESELNAYLAVYGPGQLPAGLVQPSLSILGDDRVAGHATIDLDAVRRASSRGWLDPTSYLTGHVPVSAEGLLRTRDGIARFQLESARIAGVPIPKSLLQQIVGYYSRTPDYPQGVGLDDPFPMPAGIRQIEMRRGEAVVVQQ